MHWRDQTIVRLYKHHGANSSGQGLTVSTIVFGLYAQNTLLLFMVLTGPSVILDVFLLSHYNQYFQYDSWLISGTLPRISADKIQTFLLLFFTNSATPTLTPELMSKRNIIYFLNHSSRWDPVDPGPQVQKWVIIPIASFLEIYTGQIISDISLWILSDDVYLTWVKRIAWRLPHQPQ